MPSKSGRRHRTGNGAAARRAGQSPGPRRRRVDRRTRTQFRGVQATAVVGVLRPDHRLDRRQREGSAPRRASTDFEKVYLHPGHHAGYYPGAQPIHLKLLFSTSRTAASSARRPSALEGVEKRIDVIATAIQFGGTVHDLAAAELCYAPQFGAAKDPVNLAGMIAENVLNGDMPLADWRCLGGRHVVDVREPDEFAAGMSRRDEPPAVAAARRMRSCRGIGRWRCLRRRPARLLRDAVPAPARLRRGEPLRRLHDVSRAARWGWLRPRRRSVARGVSRALGQARAPWVNARRWHPACRGPGRSPSRLLLGARPVGSSAGLSGYARRQVRRVHPCASQSGLLVAASASREACPRNRSSAAWLPALRGKTGTRVTLERRLGDREAGEGVDLLRPRPR